MDWMSRPRKYSSTFMLAVTFKGALYANAAAADEGFGAGQGRSAAQRISKACRPSCALSALVVEASLVDPPYVPDPYILGVPYHEAPSSTALSSDAIARKGGLDLAKIRADLHGVVAAYMLPVVLRVLKEGEQLPRTDSRKPIERQILSKFWGPPSGSRSRIYPTT
ncbi:hypothetical protein VTK56DRAFT_2098 [Thermocarpiscus australiensis]